MTWYHGTGVTNAVLSYPGEERDTFGVPEGIGSVGVGCKVGDNMMSADAGAAY